MLRFDARLRSLAFAAALGSSLAGAAAAQVNLSPGDVAIIGWVDNGSPNDSFAVVALADLAPGTTIYFTDNGWDAAAGAFRNTNGPTDGDGNETLMKLTVNSLVPAGTIVGTGDAPSAAVSWVATGAIPGATSGSFGPLVLAQGGDQIYAFQSVGGTNPLNTALLSVFVLDDTGTFEDATSSSTGNVPAGLSVAGNTALSFAQSGSTQNVMSFHTNALASGTRDQWLAAIHDPLNWSFGSTGALPSGSILVGGSTISYSCAGDGSLATPCPCGNVGASGRGCNNSAGTGGALLQAGGNTSPDTIVLYSTGELASAPTIFLQGDVNLPAGIVFGDGVRCAGGALKKLAVKVAVGGAASYPEVGDPSISVRSSALGDPIPSGGVRLYQAYYRDPEPSFCTDPPGNTWNVSNAVRVTW